MRSSKSRSRNKQNRNTRPSGGNIINRVFDSSGPDGKVRGTPQQIIEKYNQLYRDAQLSGDRIAAENFAQHAEHYTRMLAEAMREVDRAREEQEQWNRERQSERDRERAQRLRAQEDAANDPAFADQPDIMVDDGVPFPDMSESDAIGLVETPEEQTRAAERRDRAERPERGDRPDRGDRPERAERPERGERTERREPRAEARPDNRSESRPENRREPREPRPDRREDRRPPREPRPEAQPDTLPAFITAPTFVAAEAVAAVAVAAPSAEPPAAEVPAAEKPKPRRPRKPKEAAPGPAEAAE